MCSPGNLEEVFASCGLMQAGLFTQASQKASRMRDELCGSKPHPLNSMPSYLRQVQDIASCICLDKTSAEKSMVKVSAKPVLPAKSQRIQQVKTATPCCFWNNTSSRSRIGAEGNRDSIAAAEACR